MHARCNRGMGDDVSLDHISHIVFVVSCDNDSLSSDKRGSSRVCKYEASLSHGAVYCIPYDVVCRHSLHF